MYRLLIAVVLLTGCVANTVKQEDATPEPVEPKNTLYVLIASGWYADKGEVREWALLGHYGELGNHSGVPVYRTKEHCEFNKAQLTLRSPFWKGLLQAPGFKLDFECRAVVDIPELTDEQKEELIAEDNKAELDSSI